MKKKITIGVCGGISVYKACDVVSNLIKKDYDVHVVMTKNATNFISPLVFKSLTNNEVLVDLFSPENINATSHIDYADTSAFIVISATANIIGKLASGIYDDALTSTLAATKSKVILIPAMNTKMYENTIVQENMSKLKRHGYKFITPDCGRLACGVYGIGKLASIDRIMDELDYYLNISEEFKDKNILITLGPTTNHIDPVRYISNPSTGKMGMAFARALRNMGANVKVISGKRNIDEIYNVEFEYVVSSKDMYDAVISQVQKYDIFVSSAAVLDFTPKKVYSEKIKKTGESMILELEATKDILFEVSHNFRNVITIGFAAETNNVIENAKKKFKKKKLDYLVVNDVSRKDIGFVSDDNEVVVISKDNSIYFDKNSKELLALKILTYIGGDLD